MPPPPPLVSWAEALSSQRVGEDLCFWPAPNFGQKHGLSLSEDLVFFLLFTLFWPKNRTDYGWNNFLF